MPSRGRRSQSGQVMVLVALALVALIGSAALVLLAGSLEWQKNQLQELADSAALDAALSIGTGCDVGKANAVITEADRFLATRRTSGGLGVVNGTCATPSTGTDNFSGGLKATIHYPYQAHQQQVEVILQLVLPISFGGQVGIASTSVTRRAVAQQLSGSVPTVSATTLTCASGLVNIAGSVATQNLIVRNGTCSLYTHARFDAASGTYSDFGNVSVYNDGQTWPGTCSPVFSAICAEGYELTGHVVTTCGPATTSFLLVGDKLINPNPCAAGTAPQPVPPLNAIVPPEPNLDTNAVATLVGNGGAPCSAAGNYTTPITIGAATVGTGTVAFPAPYKDGLGFYHFRPSCYSYLNPGAVPAGGGIARLQKGNEVGPGTDTVTATLPLPSTAGTLLVANISAGASNVRSTGPAGWVYVNGINAPAEGRNEIWYLPSNLNLGGISSAKFTLAAGNTAVAQMTEWSGVLAGVAALDRSGTKLQNPSFTATVMTLGPTAVPNELVITNDGFSPNPGETFTPDPAWTSLNNSPATGYSSEYRLDLPAAVATETVTYSTKSKFSLVIATFRPAGGGAASAAVLDPGFYYFNGSGLAGGGGICLNGGTLLARDVTLEFVGQAGFSSGSCAVGGGAVNCAAPCQFGSPPCSLQVCPPNAATDTCVSVPPCSNNMSWFAAPCSVAPSPLDAAACPGSAWCPAGDRSCWNRLIWAPSGNAGQIALTGPAVRHWLLGAVQWPGTCAYTINGTSTNSGNIACGPLSISAAAGAGTAFGGDAGVSTALVEATLVE